MKFYIVHYTVLTERKIHIINQLKNAGIDDYEFIKTFDKEYIQLHPLFSKFSSNSINNAEKSLFLKHTEVFNKNKNNNNDIIIVFEDDAILTDQFLHKLNIYMENQPKEWDILFTGECSNIHDINSNDNQIFYRSNGSRGSCMYILNTHTSALLSNIINNDKEIINKPIDHWFNYIRKKYNLIYYLSEPTLVSQGSEKSLFSSSIRDRFV